MYRNDFEEMLYSQNVFDANILSEYLYNSNDGVFIVDGSGKLVVANPAVA